MIQLEKILTSLRHNDISVLNNPEVMCYCSNLATNLIDIAWQREWYNTEINNADLLLRISNIAYNCTSLDVLPLDDGVYDQLLVIYKKYNPNYQVGSEIIYIPESPENEVIDEKVMCMYVDPYDSGGIYNKDILDQHTPFSDPMRPRTMCTVVRDPISKRLINTTHKYPELVGTLDKCKFVLNEDAKQVGVFDKQSVAVFERDYIQMCLQRGVISPIEEFEMVAELKYDGVSVEAEVCGDTIISALSRGDTADNLATDLTPILGGYRFYNAGSVPKDITFGIKFEAVILKQDLDKLCQIRGKSYKNCRNAMIGLLSASDAYKFVDYITLIPLSCSLDMTRLSELNFLNHYYNSGQYNRFCILKGNYQSMLFQVREFVNSAEYVRPILPYLIDGVVISFTNPEKIEMLGRENFVNKYQMAIKFNPKKARTIFLGYTYSIGKSGDVIPMVHFKACEFLGGIHTKQTIHSYERFKQLDLTIGEEIDVDYVNDVITYITKPDTEKNRTITKNPEKFIEVCPYCGTKLVISASGKSIKCPNLHCHERNTMRMVDMLDKLGFKDFGEERIRAANILKYHDIKIVSMNPYEYSQILGPVVFEQFGTYAHNLTNGYIPIYDYKVMAAMGFTGIGEETWKSIFREVKLKTLLEESREVLEPKLLSIRGISNKTVDTIYEYLNVYGDEVTEAFKDMNILDTADEVRGERVVLTGFRDQEFIDLLTNNGYDCSPNYSVTKDTWAVIAADPHGNSGKLKKANDYGIPIYGRDEFLKKYNIEV